MECYCYLRNIQDPLSDLSGKHFTKDDSENHSTGPVVPFGSMIECHTVSAKDLSRRHQFGRKVLPGISLGCVLHAGRNLERRHFGRRH